MTRSIFHVTCSGRAVKSWSLDKYWGGGEWGDLSKLIKHICIYSIASRCQRIQMQIARCIVIESMCCVMWMWQSAYIYIWMFCLLWLLSRAYISCCCRLWLGTCPLREHVSRMPFSGQKRNDYECSNTEGRADWGRLTFSLKSLPTLSKRLGGLVYSNLPIWLWMPRNMLICICLSVYVCFIVFFV